MKHPALHWKTRQLEMPNFAPNVSRSLVQAVLPDHQKPISLQVILFNPLFYVKGESQLTTRVITLPLLPLLVLIT